MAVNGADRPAASEYLQVQTTTDSRAEAMELSRAAVAARIAACSQVAGPVASTYWWNDEIERAEEWFVFFKLPADRYEELAAFLAEKHSYDEPEIVATPIVAGSASFLTWITDETRPRETQLGPESSLAAARPAAGGVPLPPSLRGVPSSSFPPPSAASAGGRDVPGHDDLLLVLVAEGADGSGVEPEQPAAHGRQAEPAGGEHA